ncbi:MAG TPA: ATP synthase subunit I [Deltaproteobacteria bacterium]|nr:ATP synthase subunit I [Deltaproteobacteria bacterium]HQB39728.1 ATP synthase subunit I [Deltaproteobacteria bacterium]
MKATLNKENLYAFTLISSILFTAVLAIGSTFLYSARLGISILAGGSIAVMNFLWMRHMLNRIIFGAPTAPVRYAQLRFIMRLTVTAILLYLAITSGYFLITGLLAGLSSVIITIMGFSLFLSAHSGG